MEVRILKLVASPLEWFNPFSPTFFLIVVKWVYQSVQRHTRLSVSKSKQNVDLYSAMVVYHSNPEVHFGGRMIADVISEKYMYAPRTP